VISESNATASNDPMASVAAAMASAAEALKEGASDAARKVQEVLPQGKVSLGKCAYSTCYFLSYGVVFPTMFVGSLLPKQSAWTMGFSDGAAAAQDMVQQIRLRNALKKAARQAIREAQASESEIIAEGIAAMGPA